FHKPLLVFLSSERIVLAYLANAHVWIDLLIRLQSGLRFGSAPFHGVRGNRHSKSGHPVRFRRQSLSRPFRCLSISPGDEMCKCHSAVREEHSRIEGVEPHRLVEAFDRAIGIASVAADPAASLPGDSQIHVQLERAIDQQGCTIHFFEEEGAHMPCPTQRHGIVVSYFYRAFGQTRYFSLVKLRLPTVRLGELVARGS